jgi:uncharacterized iron-regulated membrane protein
MSNSSLRRWSWIHKWSSLVCTVFMLLLCLTGLPLIYHHEIGHLLGNEVEAPALPAELARNPPRANLDAVIAAGKARYPDKIMMYMSQEADEPAIWFLTMGEHPPTRASSRSRSMRAPARSSPSRRSRAAPSCRSCSTCTSTCSPACGASSSSASWACC